VFFTSTVQYLASAMNGEITLDAALTAIQDELNKNANTN
jgi:hypothetical protein